MKWSKTDFALSAFIPNKIEQTALHQLQHSLQQKIKSKLIKQPFHQVYHSEQKKTQKWNRVYILCTKQLVVSHNIGILHPYIDWNS